MASEPNPRKRKSTISAEESDTASSHGFNEKVEELSQAFNAPAGNNDSIVTLSTVNNK